MNQTNLTGVGIDDMALYIPSLYLPIQTLAEERGIPYAKLNKGLGLEKMAIPDWHEDSATMAANAVVELIERNQIDPNTIGRIYLGTESALDGAKPTATYVLEMLRRKYKGTYGVDCLRHCDVVDLTFACVGGVDALHNTLDWVRVREDRVGIVVCSDFAKYELASTGEYTQGAGAIAMLVKHNPRLLLIEDNIGVATQGVHDFFKPKRAVSKQDIIQEVLNLAGVTNVNAKDILQLLPASLEVKGVLDDNDAYLHLHKDTPIFDGPYSNMTYQSRVKEALANLKAKKVKRDPSALDTPILDQWARLVFHLPYAAHGRRMASELYMANLQEKGEWKAFAAANELEIPQRANFEDQAAFEKAQAQFLRGITKTEAYREFTQVKLQKAEDISSQVGNMYACSVFLALMGTLEMDHLDNSDLSGKKMGCLAYGSGSKSKVFEVQVQPTWKEVVQNFKITEKLAARQAVDYTTYEQLHRLETAESVVAPSGEFKLDKIGDEVDREGARYYSWAE